THALPSSWRTSSLLLERRRGGASGGNFFKFHTGVPNSQNAEALQQDFAFGYDVDLLSIAKKGEARSAVGHSAKTIELHTARQGQRDRKSTRLNSSHVSISYAVFCLKKKKKRNIQIPK